MSINFSKAKKNYMLAYGLIVILLIIIYVLVDTEITNHQWGYVNLGIGVFAVFIAILFIIRYAIVDYSVIFIENDMIVRRITPFRTKIIKRYDMRNIKRYYFTSKSFFGFLLMIFSKKYTNSFFKTLHDGLVIQFKFYAISIDNTEEARIYLEPFKKSD